MRSLSPNLVRRLFIAISLCAISSSHCYAEELCEYSGTSLREVYSAEGGRPRVNLVVRLDKLMHKTDGKVCGDLGKEKVIPLWDDQKGNAELRSAKAVRVTLSTYRTSCGSKNPGMCEAEEWRVRVE